MSGFAIICDARAGESLGIQTLALVDRAKSRKLWWVSDNPHIAICYRKRGAADFACRRLKRNGARVVAFDSAAAILRAQANEIDTIAAEAEGEGQGWDAHKGC